MNNQPHGPPGFERERELEEAQYRQRALQQQEEIAQRERDHRERQERERQNREHQTAPPHQGTASNIPLHQPVASRLPGAIHSPGGLLANHGGAAPSGPLGAPSGPGNAFGGPLHSDASRAIQHNTPTASNQLQQQQSFGPALIHHNQVNGPSSNPAFGGPLQQQQSQAQAQQDAAARLALPFGAPIPQGAPIPGQPMGQGGQQPILNDALSYLDQVKVQFADQPDVYNRFLDIMKDFKSQAIDTPGVINRVSDLFAGHPNLIQGFNTFLPPGYRIECGTGPDPNTIRVTTPMGTTVQSITGSGRALPGAGMGPQGSGSGGYYNEQRGGNWQQQQQPQHSIESPEAVFSPQNQAASVPYGQSVGQHAAYESQAAAAAAAAHQQQQRGVSQLTNAVGITLGHPPRNTQTPTPGAQAALNGNPQSGEKRGPVEFNHAISYVNKIKNRFQDRPEIYKQFLEILQTYQRESKPIQDVYAQVTHLFNTAPDLLEDFKQFLPESAAHAKAAAAAKAMEEAQQNQTPQPHGRGDVQKMPPVGNFQVPASSGKDNSKKRQRPNANASAQSNVIADSNVRAMGQGGPSNKRAKLHHKSNAPDAPMVSPTLTPILPEALPPTTTSGATQEELSFFDRVKKWMNNKAQMNEFLKLCNLFSQDLIDKNVLVHKASIFIGGNPDLMAWFKQFVSWDGREEQIENKPAPPTGRVALSNCRGLGPSYRLLPKRPKKRKLAASLETEKDTQQKPAKTRRRKPLEGIGSGGRGYSHREHFPLEKKKWEKYLAHMEQHHPDVLDRVLQWPETYTFRNFIERAIYWFGERAKVYWQERLKPCSGRDEMCNEVLNDDWASHPTWASEDSGFVAHRKNAFEEGLHRIEEERHDYDFNIEANSKVIQLLEPIAQSILSLTSEERENYRMPTGIAQQSQSIFKRVLKKIYQDGGPAVAADLFRDPCAVLPVVLARLKQKDEEWRFTQREWEKVWAAQTTNMYLKSLDHQGIHAKGKDKRDLSQKYLVDSIKTKYEEQRRARSTQAIESIAQYAFDFSDQGVILDALRLMVAHVAVATGSNQVQRTRDIAMFEKFIPTFFGISEYLVHEATNGIQRGTPDDEDDIAPFELSNGGGSRARKQGKGKKAQNMRRNLLDKRNGQGLNNGHSTSASKESTPDVDSVAEDDEIVEESSTDEAQQRWIDVGDAVDVYKGDKSMSVKELGIGADEERVCTVYKLWANQSIFIFFSVFQQLYRRLSEIKGCEDEARKEAGRAKTRMPAKDIGLIGDEYDDTYSPTDTNTYYSQVLRIVEDYVNNEINSDEYEKWLRRHYLKKGWQLYTVSDLFKILAKLPKESLGADAKDRASQEILEKFYDYRQQPTTTYKKELQQRHYTLKRLRDSELFMISWESEKKQACIHYINREDTTFDLRRMSPEDRWRYYVSSWQRVEPTEGIPRDDRPGKTSYKTPVLNRNLRETGADSEDSDIFSKNFDYNENLTLRIAANSYKIHYRGAGSEFHNWVDKRLGEDPETNKSIARERMLAVENKRSERFSEKMVMNSPIFKGLKQEEVAALKEKYRLWIEEQVFPGASGSEDVVMAEGEAL